MGLDIDLAKDLCKRIEAKCTFVESDFDALTDKLYAANARLIAKAGSPITPPLDSLRGKRVGVLQGSTQEAYANAMWRPKGVDVVAYQNQDLIYADLTSSRIDAAFQDEVAGSEGFLKQAVGKGYIFAGPALKDDKFFGVCPV